MGMLGVERCGPLVLHVLCESFQAAGCDTTRRSQKTSSQGCRVVIGGPQPAPRAPR
ncbi:hypothetical protein ACFPRL_19180 [Pseudoclavibacter helvolus]